MYDPYQQHSEHQKLKVSRFRSKAHLRANIHCLGGLINAQGHRNPESKQEESNQVSKNSNEVNKRHTPPPKAKTVSQADAELRERLEQMSGAGGACGIEYEDGKPNAMKRGVRNNMFRLI
ncbi:hypothetical protein N7536_006185 [Penicillium majusculum]|uniref:Uncharacterized protein n=1 Tax=Penicillium solitum TaxID=60172 RepID=A0A1V6RQW3_9EURO|nr:uncharacterized protein PENSOL_c001G08577 [Penicillium solitum]KAJ5695773.1 hypothetical protein N7536_006185 [Penicillium majusculum]OQE03864.1 hypothetical protein PENSOL_c001G08577 [Penicillium solitum]